MTRHLLRDYVTQNTTAGAPRTFIPGYLMAMFLRRVLGYTYVGDTNYNINSVGSLLISTADSTPTGAPTFAGGSRAGINLGLGKEFNVSIPSGTRVVSSADNGRIIVLKSTTNPNSNSGCFLIQNFDTGTNSYQVDYRTGTTVTGNSNFVSTTIASGSNNVTLPTATINVVSTTGFAGSGTIFVTSTNGVQTVTYTATNSTQFGGCSGGTGVINTGNLVTNGTTSTLPQATINVVSTTGFTPNGTLYVYTSTGRQTVTYTGITATTFTGCTGGTGNMSSTNPIIQTINTTIAAGSNGQTLPQSTINVASTTISSTTITASSNNVYLPTGTINVTTTSGFPTAGNIYVATSNGFQLVTYTSTTGATFTGCTGGTGFMSTGGQVYAGYAPSGTVYVTSSTGVQQISYTNVSGTQFLGCTGGSGSLTTGNLVYFSPSVPLIEPTDSMNWYLYEKDANCPGQGAANTQASGTYRGFGNSTTPRLILQSPHALAWQVRICNETGTDSGTASFQGNGNCAVGTMVSGFGGNGSGDFAVGGPHLHLPLYYNSNSLNYQGCAVGYGGDDGIQGGVAGVVYRITIIGDDTGIGVNYFGRRPGDASNPKSCWVAFGIPEAEPTPLPPNKEARLFSLGSGDSTSPGNNFGNNLNDMSWYPANIGGGSQGVSFQATTGAQGQNSLNPTPVSCNISLMTYVSGVGQGGSPIFDGSAGDSPWIGAVELFNADLISGVFQTWTGASAANFAFPQIGTRFIGTIPHIREGRANFTEFTTTADFAFQHMRRGMWIFWGGPPVVT